METLSQLLKITAKSKKRLGRGIGSGKGGHTTGRGQKGYKARYTTKLTFDGTKIKKSWIKRLPFMRGKNLNLKRSTTTIFNLSQINRLFSAKDTVTPQTLGVATAKILAGGQITRPLTFKNVKISAAAKKLIIAAGGNILDEPAS